VNNAGDVLSSSLLALSWPGNRCPRKAVGLVGPGPHGPKVLLAPKLRCSAGVRGGETVATEQQFCFVCQTRQNPSIELLQIGVVI